MATALLLRFDAPIVSFGGPMVDKRGVTQAFPALSMLAGLLGNALGYDHRDAALLAALQGRLRYAVRRDREGERLRDYQTADLSQGFLLAQNVAWTTRGHVIEREGGDASEGTTERIRDYWADSVVTVALSLRDSGDGPSVGEVGQALVTPERPLFLGRKCCLPAAGVLLSPSPIECDTVGGALVSAPRIPRRRGGWERPCLRAWWPADDPMPPGVEEGSTRVVAIADKRDWVNQIHGGRRLMREGMIDPPDCDIEEGKAANA